MVGPPERLVIHPRVHTRHPELTDADVLAAWNNSICSRPRLDKEKPQHLVIGLDGQERLVEMLATRKGDSWLVFHAQTPPTKRTYKELGVHR